MKAGPSRFALMDCQNPAEIEAMHRRASMLVVTTLLCLGSWLVLRPMVGLPMLTNLDLPRPGNAEAAHLAASAFVPRAFYGRRLEPAYSVLHGAGQSDRASFDRYSAATGTHPALFMSYVDLRDDLPTYFMQLAANLASFDAPDRQTWPQIGLSLNRGQAASHYEASTAAGADDAAIAQFCEGVRLLQRPVYLRVGYEFNGPWNGYQPAAYVAAFRRIANALHACTGKVALVWDWSVDAEMDAVAGGYSETKSLERLRSFYPGDAAVDWWAVNFFKPAGITWYRRQLTTLPLEDAIRIGLRLPTRRPGPRR